MNIQEFRNRLLTEEGACWAEIQQLRANVEGNDFVWASNSTFDLLALSPEEVLQAAQEKFAQILGLLDSYGFDFDSFDPGHGRGHIVRDYINGAHLALDSRDVSPPELYVGLLAGFLHDIGCGVLYRYDEPNRAVRHAEAGALLILELSKEAPLLFEIGEQIPLAYAIAAHTHYLKSSEVLCTDGVTRQVTPYVDTYSHSGPVLHVWLPRWIDRLDLCGPSIIGRHFLTLGRDHHDYSAQHGFTPVKFQAAMRPLLRSPEEIAKDPLGSTMLEHVRMLVNSQTSDSPYGKFDSPAMIGLRDFNVGLTRPILDMVSSDSILSRLEDGMNIVRQTFVVWEDVLGTIIEPSRMGRQNAHDLCAQLLTLEPSTQAVWHRIFQVFLGRYSMWADAATSAIWNGEEALPGYSFRGKLPPLTDDVLALI